MKKLHVKLAWFFGMILLVPGIALAQGWYVGIGAGQTNMEVVPSADTGTGESIDDSDTAFKVFGGYGFSNNFAVEFGYADLGEFTQRNPASSFNVDIESSAIFAELVGSAKIHDRVDVFAKLGVAYWDTELTVFGSGVSASGDENSLDPVIGIGFDFRVGEQLGIRLEWEQYQNVGEGTGVAAAPGALELLGDAVDVFGVGLTFQF